MNDWNENKAEKRHASTNMEKLQTTRIMMADVQYVASGAELQNFRSLDFFTECTYPKPD
jgi:hypothetical protein